MAKSPTQQTAIQTFHRDAEKVLDTNTVGTGVTPPGNQPTKPKPGDPGVDAVLEVTENHVKLTPFGEGADGSTMTMILSGWERVSGPNGTNDDEWIPTFLGSYTITLSASTGDAGRLITENDRIADTIVGSGGPSLSVLEVFSPGTDSNGFILVDGLVFSRISAAWLMGTATNGNLIQAQF